MAESWSFADLMAARWSAEIVASGQSKYAVPICTPDAPNASAAAIPRPIGNSARSNDRNFHRIDDLRDESERTELRCQVARQEHAAVAAGLDTLGNDCIDAALLEPARLHDRRRSAEDHAAGGFEAIDQGFLGQPEMEAHDCRSQLHDNVAHFRIKGRARVGRKLRRIDIELGVVGSEPFEPRGLHGRIPLRHMTEEIEVQRFGRLGADFGNHVAQLRGSQRGTRKGSEPARPANCCRHIETYVTSPHGGLDDGMVDPE